MRDKYLGSLGGEKAASITYALMETAQVRRRSDMGAGVLHRIPEHPNNRIDDRPRFPEISLRAPRRMRQRHEHLPATPAILTNVVLQDRVSPAARIGADMGRIATRHISGGAGCREISLSGSGEGLGRQSSEATRPSAVKLET